MWKLLYCLVVISIESLVDSSSYEPIVNTSLGAMKGYVLETREKRKVAAFTAIPFALPPVNELRFMAPVPSKPWEGILDASQVTPACVGRNPYTRDKSIVGQEDCLNLNVYTPLDRVEEQNTPAEPSKPLKQLPVMMFIHGGGLMCGDSSMYGPQYLLDRDVVLVTTNYRLGPLGFLSTLDEHCPGNNGMKDQQMAMRWIQQHIHNFGGLNSSVTIFGESAGGASVHFHMISESSRGLFHKGISESGTALVPWAAPAPGEALRQALLLAKFLECPQAPSHKMLACLRTKDAYKIIDTEFQFYKWDYEPMTPFKVVVEPDLPGAFLSQEPSEAISNTEVPWLTGLNRDEGCLKSVWIVNNDTLMEEYISGFEAIAPVSFYYENSPQSPAITKKIQEFYNLNNNGIDDSTADVSKSILEAYSDAYFNYPLVEAVELTLRRAQAAPVYLYQLSYEGTNSFSQIFGAPDGKYYGICHADELMYLFPIPFLKYPYKEEDIAMLNLFLTLWTNFATTGNPNLPEKLPFVWNPVSHETKMEYLNIKSSETTMDAHIAERSRFWGDLPVWHHATPPLHKRLGDEL